MKDNESCSHQEHVRPFLAGAGWLTHHKSPHGVNNVKLSDEADSADHNVAEEFLKFLFSVIQESGYVDRFLILMRVTIQQGQRQRSLCNANGILVDEHFIIEAHRILTIYFPNVPTRNNENNLYTFSHVIFLHQTEFLCNFMSLSYLLYNY